MLWSDSPAFSFRKTNDQALPQKSFFGFEAAKKHKKARTIIEDLVLFVPLLWRLRQR